MEMFQFVCGVVLIGLIIQFVERTTSDFQKGEE